ncbi:MAG TPA: Hint domain-containing protein [Rhodopila sp.]
MVNAGLISGYDGVLLSDGGTVTNQATGTITGNEAIYGTYHDHASPTLVNAGVIVGQYSAVLLFAGGTVTNQASGTLTGAQVSGIYGRSGALSVVNYGVISGHYDGDGARIGDGGSVTNHAGGTISGYVAVYSVYLPITVVNAGDIAGGPQYDGGEGVALRGGYITNLSSGTIAGGYAAIYGGASTTVVNAGLIDGFAGYGIQLTNNGYIDNQANGTITGGVMSVHAQGGDTIDNAGLILAGTVAGTIAGTNLYSDRAFFNDIVLSGYGNSVTNQTTGTIVGAIAIVSISQLTLTNAGTITGYSAGIITFGGGTIANQANATISGPVAVYAYTEGLTVAISNAGLIQGGMTASYEAGVAAPAGGTIVNQVGGTIAGYFGIHGGGYTGGFYGGRPLTIVNAGLISGIHAAVQIEAGYNDLLAVAPGGTFTGLVDGGNTVGATATSTLELTAGTGGGTLSGLGTQFIDFAQITIDAGASWTLTGSNAMPTGTTVTNAGTLTLQDTTLSDAGDFVNNGAILIDPSSITLADLTGTGVTTIEAGSMLTVLGTVATTEAIVFTGTNDLLGANPTAFAGQIDGFTFGDTIQLTGVLDGTSAEIVNGNTLQIDRSGNPPVDLTLDPGISYVGDLYTVSSTGAVTETPCFLRDTRIRTETGEVLVQDLAVGDCVVTLSGRSRPITWIGTGQVLVSPSKRSAATPIIVRKSALADNVPYDDLRITKGHSLFVDGVLIPAEFLLNHRSILWDDHKKEVTFYHIELDTHDVLVANGAAAESYRDDGNRWLFQNANTGWDQSPKPACAPVLTGGPIVDAAWKRLLDRNGPRPNVALIDDPDLHVLVDGTRLNATTRSDGFYVFTLPHPHAAVHIVSRAATPEELGLARDPRRLGVALRRIVLRQGTRFRTIEAADDRLIDGFHGFEADNAMRWTDGDATLPAALFDGFRGPVELVLHWGGSTRYPAFADAGGQVAA